MNCSKHLVTVSVRGSATLRFFYSLLLFFYWIQSWLRHFVCAATPLQLTHCVYLQSVAALHATIAASKEHRKWKRERVREARERERKTHTESERFIRIWHKPTATNKKQIPIKFISDHNWLSLDLSTVYIWKIWFFFLHWSIMKVIGGFTVQAFIRQTGNMALPNNVGNHQGTKQQQQQHISLFKINDVLHHIHCSLHTRVAKRWKSYNMNRHTLTIVSSRYRTS